MTAPAQDKAELLSREEIILHVALVAASTGWFARLVRAASAAYDETGVLYRDRLAKAEKEIRRLREVLPMVVGDKERGFYIHLPDGRGSTVFRVEPTDAIDVRSGMDRYQTRTGAVLASQLKEPS